MFDSGPDKGRDGCTAVSPRLSLGADTIVLIDEEILGQPGDAASAERMLKLLSGKWHQVLTGVALIRMNDERRIVEHEVTRVRFAELSEEEISWYVGTGEPLDKAGAYAIQGRAPPSWEIQGDYFNIVGLPYASLYQVLSTAWSSCRGRVRTFVIRKYWPQLTLTTAY